MTTSQHTSIGDNRLVQEAMAYYADCLIRHHELEDESTPAFRASDQAQAAAYSALIACLDAHTAHAVAVALTETTEMPTKP